MDASLAFSMAAVGGALTTTWPTLVLLRRVRRELRLAQRKLDHDDLTGLASRRAFTAFLAASRGAGEQPGIVLADLNRFKQVNDLYGHKAGDDVLCQVADRLRTLGSEVWLAARLAGDEFVFVVDADAAVAVTGQVRDAIGGTPFTLGDHRITVTASVGVALAHGFDDQEILRRADVAMYREKAAWRRREMVRPTALAPGDPVDVERPGRGPSLGSRMQVLPAVAQPAGTTTT